MPTDHKTIRKLSGAQPGQLDSSQPGRLLRAPNSRLAFASYHPHAANGLPNISGLSLDDESRRPKRVVVETIDGMLSWRFVPRARLAPDVQSEGTWPRVIIICGESVEVSEDQWDIYKLDPLYDCFVPAPPELTTVTKATPPTHSYTPPTSSAATSTKRGLSPESAALPEHPVASGSKRKIEVPVFNVDEEEQESMLVDEDEASRRAAVSERSRKLREAINRERQERREKMARRDEKLSNIHQGTFVPPNLFGNGQSSTQNKRKVSGNNKFSRTTESPERRSVDREDDEPRESATFVSAKGSKRARTLSPNSAKRDLEAKRLERERRKKEKQERKLQDWRQNRHDRLMKEAYQNFNNDIRNGNGHHIPTQPEMHELSDEDLTDDEDPEEEDIEEVPHREAKIAESRRKLAQLEEDRPLWEAAARERLAKEEAEAAAAKRAAEARRAQAAAERQRAEREAAEQRRREAQRQRQKEDALRREREAKKQQQRFAHGPWTTQRALERYKTLCEAFDATKFSPAQPLTFEEVPWPVLRPPFSFSVEDIEWAAVEDFFRKVKPHLRSQDYKVLVEKSHRRFHPDRWRARGLLTSIVDEEERGCIEVAANCVAQALTPIWSGAKQRP